jgi:hypothetical protein
LGLVSPSKKEATLTLYVHDGSATGPLIPGAQVTDQDASGNSFQQTTDSSGFVTITGNPGTWHFEVSADGYQTNIWDQEITETDSKDASLQKASSNIVGKWAIHNVQECNVEFYNYVTDDVIDFHRDGTFTYYGGTEIRTGEWVQNGDTIRLRYNPRANQQSTVSAEEGTINGDTITWTASWSFQDLSCSIRWFAVRVDTGN